MRLINIENKLELIINDDLLKEIRDSAIKHYPNEFGGFLIGQYTNNFKTVEITNVILPLKYKGSPISFLRLTNDIKDVFSNVFNNSGQYYVGEWHSHPNGSTMYSQTDLNAMNEIVDCDTVSIKNPILLILSVNNKSTNKFTFYYYNNKKLVPYE